MKARVFFRPLLQAKTVLDIFPAGNAVLLGLAWCLFRFQHESVRYFCVGKGKEDALGDAVALVVASFPLLFGVQGHRNDVVG